MLCTHGTQIKTLICVLKVSETSSNDAWWILQRLVTPPPPNTPLLKPWLATEPWEPRRDMMGWFPTQFKAQAMCSPVSPFPLRQVGQSPPFPGVSSASQDKVSTSGSGSAAAEDGPLAQIAGGKYHQGLLVNKALFGTTVPWIFSFAFLSMHIPRLHG